MRLVGDRADINRSATLAHIGVHGPTSRASLARALGVSPALITQTTKRLLMDGLLVELETTPSTGGRPARLLGLASTAGTAIGVKVAADHVTVIETGIDGGVRRLVTGPFDAVTPTAVGDLVAILRGFVADVASLPLLGIGVAVPGAVDSQATGVVEATVLGWQRLPVGDTLRRELDVPVLVENNVNALAVAERLFGEARGHDAALIITIGTGIGAGIIVDGAVVRGATGGAGEFGHMPVMVDGPRCQCGAEGCLEALVGQDALAARAIGRGILTPGEGIDRLRELADAGDPASQSLFAWAGELLGRALAGAVNFLDPEIVVVLGEGVTAWTHWAAGFEPAFRASLMPRKRGTVVAVEAWHDDSWAQGAAALVLATPFDSQGIAGAEGELVRARMGEGPST